MGEEQKLGVAIQSGSDARNEGKAWTGVVMDESQTSDDGAEALSWRDAATETEQETRWHVCLSTVAPSADGTAK